MHSSERRKPQTEIRFPIEARTDKYGETYYIGWTDAPAQLDMSDCAFFIFLGDEAEVCIRKRRDAKDLRGGKRQRSKPRERSNGNDQPIAREGRDGDAGAALQEYEEEEIETQD